MLALPLALTGCGGGGGGGKCDNAIPHCASVKLPDGATDCKQARCEKCQAGLTEFRDDEGAYCGLDCPIPNCTAGSNPLRTAASCADAKVTCQVCAGGYELQMDRQTMEYTGNCSFACTSTQLDAGCAPRSCTDGQTCGKCLPGFVLQAVEEEPVLAVKPLPAPLKDFENPVSARFLEFSSGVAREAASNASAPRATLCVKADTPTDMTFYMYRAQSKVDYPPEDTDLASPAGVVWYIHNEVVARKQTCPGTGSPSGRHYDINRVLRYKVTVHNTQEVFDHPPGHRQIGHFTQFDGGRCTEPTPEDCPKVNWEPYGYMVGCQKQAFQKYYANPEEYGCYWYSLPGACPSMTHTDKTKACMESEPGGRCAAPDGSRTCTWTYEDAGEVLLDDLSGIKDLKAFCDAGNYEYDDATDSGKGTTFWNDKLNATRGKERVLKLLQLFASNYPTNQSALELPDPVCDGW